MWGAHRLRVLVAASSVASLALSLVTLYIVATPAAVIEGGVSSGRVYLVGYSLQLLGKPARLPALESVSVVSILLILGSMVPLSLSALTLPAILRGCPGGVAAEAAAASAVIAGINFSLLYSILRLVYGDVIPAIPMGGIVDTPAGRLVLNPSTLIYGPPYTMYEIVGRPMAGLPLALLVTIALIALGAYTLYEAFQAEVLAGCREPRGP